ncbi:hypothetical protein RhiirA4_540548 [Rhizophagus irregularis]|uniref:Uncharacterized protein n=1 Tax=Rhizophagus irregularis TaxID=588596 RepID=A0A2I1G7Q2_9GLOM|nr:hypothetical protein RhiirA4_540548 [Rhizophagus irregularis]
MSQMDESSMMKSKIDINEIDEIDENETDDTKEYETNDSIDYSKPHNGKPIMGIEVSPNGKYDLSKNFVSETIDDIVPVVIDKKLTVNNLKDEIKNARQDLREINIDLYDKDFAQDKGY